MKRYFFLLALCLGFSLAVQAQVQKPGAAKKTGPQIEFNTAEVDYGTIEQGGEPFRTFTFTNTGTEPLLITGAKGSCGCTVPTYPKGAIPPGETGEIKVRYDTNRVGPFMKTVTLTTNVSEEPVQLKIKGKVESKPEAPAGTPAKQQGMFNGGF